MLSFHRPPESADYYTISADFLENQDNTRRPRQLYRGPLLEKGRISFTIPFGEWLEAAAHPRTVRIAPISAVIAAEVAALPKSFHRDPAGRLIVATCRVLKLPLLSASSIHG